VVGGIGAALVFAGWQVNSGWDPEMRWWKSFGVGAAFLIWFIAFIGPAARLWQPLTRLLPWRREFGIWFAVVALVHFYLIWNGWARWGVLELLGYQYVPELDTYLRFEPGFGLANLQGLLALLLALVLAATSFDKAVEFLGVPSWRWLHNFTYLIFYTVALHSLYFAFIHFTPAPHRILMGLPTTYPENVLRFGYVAMLLSVFVAQVAAFAKTVRLDRRTAPQDAKVAS
jgi:sulfoxide reductase heme-binding subunit YedZ